MTTERFKLFDAEYRMMEIVWEQEPIPSGELARQCFKHLDWKRTTTYTVLRKLCERGVLQNQNATVRSLVSREQVRHHDSHTLLENRFDGSLPRFIAAFIGDGHLSEKEKQEILELLSEK